jgi:hypothetical protein
MFHRRVTREELGITRGNKILLRLVRVQVFVFRRIVDADADMRGGQVAVGKDPGGLFGNEL